MNPEETDDSFLEYSPQYRKFCYLMSRRIVEILLVSSTCKSYILEEELSN